MNSRRGDAPTPFLKKKSPKQAKVMLWIVAFGLFVSGVSVWPATALPLWIALRDVRKIEAELEKSGA